ncbi:MAG: ABC transporter ATP-binding protein, partial [Prevotella sp.]|nr:ABC transporter ATP-binding protein [Prevotella sp.]
ASSPSEGSGEVLSYAERKEIQKKIRKAQRAVEESESKIAKLEARKKELDDLLMTPENASNMELVTEYTNLQRELDEENERWLILSEELETLRL